MTDSNPDADADADDFLKKEDDYEEQFDGQEESEAGGEGKREEEREEDEWQDEGGGLGDEFFDELLENAQGTEVPETGGGPIDTGPAVHYAGDMPDTGEMAEVVLITTSLGSMRGPFYGSRRAQNLLDCKDVVYILIDANRDMSTARDLVDVELVQEWRLQKLLKLVGPEHGDQSIELPQAIIDGIPVGNDIALQDLEEDGDLEWLIARAACPACLHEKSLDALSCSKCGVTFASLITQSLLDERRVVQIYKGQVYNLDDAQQKVL